MCLPSPEKSSWKAKELPYSTTRKTGVFSFLSESLPQAGGCRVASIRRLNEEGYRNDTPLFLRISGSCKLPFPLSISVFLFATKSVVEKTKIKVSCAVVLLFKFYVRQSYTFHPKDSGEEFLPRLPLPSSPQDDRRRFFSNQGRIFPASIPEGHPRQSVDRPSLVNQIASPKPIRFSFRYSFRYSFG